MVSLLIPIQHNNYFCGWNINPYLHTSISNYIESIEEQKWLKSNEALIWWSYVNEVKMLTFSFNLRVWKHHCKHSLFFLFEPVFIKSTGDTFNLKIKGDSGVPVRLQKSVLFSVPLAFIVSKMNPEPQVPQTPVLLTAQPGWEEIDK